MVGLRSRGVWQGGGVFLRGDSSCQQQKTRLNLSLAHNIHTNIFYSQACNCYHNCHDNSSHDNGSYSNNTINSAQYKLHSECTHHLQAVCCKRPGAVVVLPQWQPACSDTEDTSTPSWCTDYQNCPLLLTGIQLDCVRSHDTSSDCVISHDQAGTSYSIYIYPNRGSPVHGDHWPGLQ